MSLSGEIKNKIIKDNARGEADTGSPEVQVALLTERISELTAHFEKHKKDHHSNLFNQGKPGFRDRVTENRFFNF